MNRKKKNQDFLVFIKYANLQIHLLHMDNATIAHVREI